MKTFIRRHGNKSRYLTILLQHIPSSYGRYFEPFVGSGALFLSIQPSKWIINDINKDIMNIWTNIHDDTSKITRYIRHFGRVFSNKSKQEKTSFCRALTSQLESMPYDAKRAATYMVLTYCAYMGNIVNNNKLYFPGLEMNLYDSPPSFLKTAFFENLKQVCTFMNASKGISRLQIVSFSSL